MSPWNPPASPLLQPPTRPASPSPPPCSLFSPKTWLWRTTWEKLFPSPAAHRPSSPGKAQRWPRVRGRVPHYPTGQYIHSPHTGVTRDRDQVGTKDGRSSSHPLCLSPGHAAAWVQEQGCPPVCWQCPDPPSTDSAAAAILTLPHCSACSQRGWGQAGFPLPGSPLPSPCGPSWLKPFQLVWMVKKKKQKTKDLKNELSESFRKSSNLLLLIQPWGGGNWGSCWGHSRWLGWPLT